MTSGAYQHSSCAGLRCCCCCWCWCLCCRALWCVVNVSNRLLLCALLSRCCLCVIIIQILCPRKVFMLRGNHELRRVNGWEAWYKEGSFIAQCKKRFGVELGSAVWEEVNAAFDCLPFAAVVDDRVCETIVCNCIGLMLHRSVCIVCSMMMIHRCFVRMAAFHVPSNVTSHNHCLLHTAMVHYPVVPHTVAVVMISPHHTL